MAIMIKENISVLFVVARLKLLLMSTMAKRDKVALDVIKYSTVTLAEWLAFVSS